MSPHDTAQLTAIAVPGTDRSVMATLIDGEPRVSIRHACDAIGIEPARQIQKLKARSWASVYMTYIQLPGDTQRREIAMVDRRTFTMWLATLDPSRVNDEARPIIEAFQREAADALDAYFHEGGAINPDASEDQLERLGRIAATQAAVLRALRGIVDPKHLEAKGRIVLARALGEAPEIASADVPLYVSDYLRSKGMPATLQQAKAPGFGKRLKARYIVARDREPATFEQELPNGSIRKVCAYTESDRPLFDEVWDTYYAEAVTA